MDVYVISFVTEINKDELYQIWRESGRVLGNFEAYKTKFSELREAYDKMKGIKNKPDFIKVYRGRPALHGKRFSIHDDFTLSDGTSKSVITNRKLSWKC